MNGYHLIRKLHDAGQLEAAKEVTKLLEERERDRPHLQALEYELDWLRGYLRRDVRYIEISETEHVEATDSEGAYDVPIAFKVGERKAGQEDSSDTWLAVNGCPRLFAILQGSLPSLEKFQKGRRP